MKGLVYAGIGSRNTPDAILGKMIEWGRWLARRGWTLRSGAADGADAAFEVGAVSGEGATEIMLPWPGFNGHLTGWAVERFATFGRAMRIASSFHPAWSGLKTAQRKLMARSVLQVLGRDLQSPVAFVLCWAPRPVYEPDGRIVDAKGGTGLAIRLSAAQNIPVFHFDDMVGMSRLTRFIEEFEGRSDRKDGD